MKITKRHHRPAEVKYMPQLDGLRALAVFGVILDHWLSGLPRSFQKFVAPLDLSSLGVQCFFVLSGFLITKLLLADKASLASTGEILRNFYFRRVLRIFPIYFFTLILAACFYEAVRDDFWWHALFLTNILASIQNAWPQHTGHFWSLSVEEQFYLIWPLLALGLPNASLARVAIGLMMLAPALRFIFAGLYGSSSKLLYVGTLCNVDLLATGALMACLQYEGVAKEALYSKRFLTMVPLVGLISFALLKAFGSELVVVVLARTILSVSFGCVIVLASDGVGSPFRRILASQILVWIGAISYGLYVYHPFLPQACIAVGRFIGVVIPDYSYYVRFPIFMGALLLVAWSSAKFVERPIRRFGH